jgi:hypothetical protein
MVVHLYSSCYNEEVLMPYFLRHYSCFVDKIFIFDNHSNDSTPRIVDSFPKTERAVYGNPNFYYERDLINFKNEAYKNSRGVADWVIVVDVDEFIYHKNLISILRMYKERHITFPKISGYDMVGFDYPKSDAPLYEIINEGVPSSLYCKRAVFDPRIDINYIPGAHKCNPKGKILENNTAEIKLLHYRYLCKDFFIKNIKKRMSRISEENIKRGWGLIKPKDGKTLDEWGSEQYENARQRAVKVLSG